jgi:protein FRG1
MSDAVYAVKSGKLKLKGEKQKKKKKEKKRKRENEEAVNESKRKRKEEQADTAKHGGWWAVTQFKHLTGPVAIQLKGCYIRAVDDGTFTIGAPHDEGTGPEPEEVLLAIKVNDNEKVEFGGCKARN